MEINRNFTTGPESDVVISSRVRFARNLAEFAFTDRLTPEVKLEIREMVEKGLGPAKLENIHMEDLPPVDRQVLVEQHLISEELAKGKVGQGVCISKDKSISVMINEEDHIRVQFISAGFLLPETFKKAAEICVLLEQVLPIAYSEKYGFLTACPSNTGTGLRASVMVHLPTLTAFGRMPVIIQDLTKAGFAVRGYLGEHSDAIGNMYQLSNQVTLGISEQDILTGLSEMAKKVFQLERKLRIDLYAQKPVEIQNSVFRSYGALRYARQMSEAEAFHCIGDLRLGQALGFLPDVDDSMILKLTDTVGKAGIEKKTGKKLKPKEIEMERAAMIRQIITMSEK